MESEGIAIQIDMEVLAKAVVEANWGAIRFLSAFTKALKEKGYTDDNLLAQNIEDLVNKG
jgi:hypothetical protein